MGQKSIKKNYIYNLSYQMLVLLIPLITTPYLSRVIGADGIGTVSYVDSLVSYFVMFATLGISVFGQREISYVQEDKEKRTKVFWETKLLQFMTSGLAIIVYIPYVWFQSSNRLIFVILSLNLLSVVANINWFFQGLEEFGKIVFRNFLFKLANLAYIFIFVKTHSDLNKYAFGIAFFSFLGNVSLWFYMRKYIGKPNFKELHPLRNLKPVLALFLPTVAIQIYTVLDKTMIGVITKNEFENGYYEQSIKLSKMVLTVVTALGTVMIPRIGYHFSKGDDDTVKMYMYRAYRFVWCLGIPLCFGLIGVAGNFVPWFLGDDFIPCISLLKILSFLILAIGINNVTGMQYLIPTKRQNMFTLTVVIGAVVNFFLNMFLIPRNNSFGAAIASVVAETVIALVQIYIVRKELSAKKIFMSSGLYLLAGTVMLVVLNVVGAHLAPSFLNTVILVGCGGIVYVGLLLIFRDQFFIGYSKSFLGKITKKFAKS